MTDRGDCFRFALEKNFYDLQAAEIKCWVVKSIVVLKPMLVLMVVAKARWAECAIEHAGAMNGTVAMKWRTIKWDVCLLHGLDCGH